MFKDNVVILTLTPADIDYLGKLLQERPIKEALPLLQLIVGQVDAQKLPDPPAVEPPPAAAPPIQDAVGLKPSRQVVNHLANKKHKTG